MTVKTLNNAEKEFIRTAYSDKTYNISELAKHLGTSERTVGRVLKEFDLATPQQTLRGDAYLVMELLRKLGIKAPDLETVLSSPSLATIRDVIVALPDSDYNTFLASIIHMREARKHNVHVQTAMLNLQQKVDRNEQINKAGKQS